MRTTSNNSPININDPTGLRKRNSYPTLLKKESRSFIRKEQMLLNEANAASALTTATKRADKAWGHGKKALAVAAAIFATAIVTDLAMDANQARDVRIEKHKANKKADERQRKEEEKYGDVGYNYETYDEVQQKAERGKKFQADPVLRLMRDEQVLSNLYTNRTGHTRMGSPKFIK